MEKSMLMRSFLEALDRAAPAELSELISPDFTFETVSTASGPSIVWDHARFLNELPDILRSLFPDGFNYVYGQSVSDGIHGSMEGSAETVTAQGRSYVNRYHWFFVFDGDKISAAREYLDSYAVYEAFRP